MALSLNPVVNVSLNVLSSTTTRASLTLGTLITADTTLDDDTFTIYSSLEELSADFTTGTDVYNAGVVYFAQSPTPTQLGVFVSATAITSSNIATVLGNARAINGDWLACYIIGADNATLIAAASSIESFSQKTFLFLDSDDADVLNNASNNLFAQLKNAALDSTFGLYSETPYAGVSAMAFSMANNSLIPNSFYTMDAKRLPNIAPSDITEAQITNIKGNNGNVYINRGGYYMLESGTVFSGKYYDEVLGIYALVDEIQKTVLDLITSTSKIPQTDLGVSQIVNVINGACNKYVGAGFIAGGTWTGGTVYNLNNGDVLSNGYLVQAQPVSEQTSADREARKSPVIYVCIKLAGAIQSVLIRLNINR